MEHAAVEPTERLIWHSCQQKLEALEREEELREKAGFYDNDDSDDDDEELQEIRKTAAK